jgi:hypothetical protein
MLVIGALIVSDPPSLTTTSLLSSQGIAFIVLIYLWTCVYITP